MTYTSWSFIDGPASVDCSFQSCRRLTVPKLHSMLEYNPDTEILRGGGPTRRKVHKSFDPKRTENPSEAGQSAKKVSTFSSLFFLSHFSHFPPLLALQTSSLLPLSHPSFLPPEQFTLSPPDLSGLSVKDHLCVFLLLFIPF